MKPLLLLNISWIVIFIALNCISNFQAKANSISCHEFYDQVPVAHTVGYETYLKLLESKNLKQDIARTNKEILNQFISKTYDSAMAKKLHSFVSRLDGSSFDFLKLVSFLNALSPKARSEAVEDYIFPSILSKNIIALSSDHREPVRQAIKDMSYSVLDAINKKMENISIASENFGVDDLILTILNEVDQNLRLSVKTDYGLISHSDILDTLYQEFSVQADKHYVMIAEHLKNEDNPDGLFLLTMDDVGIRTFNTYSKKSIPIFGLTDKELFVDGKNYRTISFFKHDIAHAILSASRFVSSLEHYHKVTKEIDNRHRIMYDIIDFLAFHEINVMGSLKQERGYTSVSAWQLTEMISKPNDLTSFESQVKIAANELKFKLEINEVLLKRFMDDRDFANQLPGSWRKRSNEESHQFVIRISSYFYEAFAVWALKNR